MRHGISRRDGDLSDLYPRMRDAHEYLSRGRRDPEHDRGKRSLMAIARPLLGASAGAAVAGVLTGRLNHWNIPNTPIPIGLALGVAGQAAAYFNIGGPISADLGYAGIGALASWVNMLSTGWGQQMRARAGQQLGPITAGVGCAQPAQPAQLAPAVQGAALPMPRPRPLTEAEIAAMSHQMRAAA